MIRFLKELWHYLMIVLRSKYKWMAIFFLVWLYRIDFMPDSGGGVAKIIQIVTLCGIFYYIHKYQNNIVSWTYGKLNMPVKSLMVLYSYAAVSTLWAFVPAFALFLSVQNLIMIMAMAWFFNQFTDFRNMEKGFVSFALIIITFECLCARINNPSVFIHFLGGGSASALCFSYCVAEWFKAKSMDKKRARFLKHSMIWALVLMVSCTSTGANAAAIFGWAVACMFAGKTILTMLLLFLTGFLYFNQGAIETVILTLNPGKTMEMIESGNGRETIWAALMANANQKPIFGWGYACIERTASNVLEGQILSDAHNNYIGMYGSLGIVGLILFVYHLIISAFTTFFQRMKFGYLGLFTAICTAAVNSYSYGFLSGKGCSITIIYFSIIALSYYYGKISYSHEQNN